MVTTTFDTYKFIQRLKEAGIPENQAEAITEGLKQAQGEMDLATKQDLRELEYRLTTKVGAMLAIAVTVLAVLVKLL
jgi:hypothetical protein